MQSIIHPTYFPSISHFVILANSEVIFEIEDNYQKQTYRNRTYLYGPNGKQLLSVPMIHTKTDGHQKFKDVRIETNFNWQKQHWKTIETAYRTSPFFEFYEDEIHPIFEKKHSFLMDLNFETIELISDCLQFENNFTKTTSYHKNSENIADHRNLANVKNKNLESFDKYVQVFSEKHGFINDLSVLDLLFNEGPNTITYLENQKNKL